MVCEACKGPGWLLADNSDHGLRIERCDACEHFKSDDEAVEHVASLAKAIEVLVNEPEVAALAWTCSMCSMQCVTATNQMSIWRRIVHHLRTVHKMVDLPSVGPVDHV